MTNVFSKPGKLPLRKQLFQVGIDALKKEGWNVERIPGAGKASLRRITRNGESLRATIRTTQDTWFAFARDDEDREWVTLAEADLVVAVSVDDAEEPKYAQAHIISGDEARDRFDRAYQARKEAGHTIPTQRGVWISLYHHETEEPVNRIGAGAGLANPAVLRVPIEQIVPGEGAEEQERLEEPDPDHSLTIAEAKRRLALTYGISPSNVKITIEA